MSGTPLSDAALARYQHMLSACYIAVPDLSELKGARLLARLEACRVELRHALDDWVANRLNR